MTLTTQIRNRIKQLPNGKTFGYQDLSIEKEVYVTAAKIMERLQKDGFIKKLSKGQFYKPEKTVFGELKPDYNELLRPYLFENGKRIAYETGTTLYNKLGFTTQIAFTIKIASRGKQFSINRENLKLKTVKSYAEITEKNYETLGLLDVFKDIKQIPDCSVNKAINRIFVIINQQDAKQIDQLIKYALVYPPRVRALLGAVLERIGNNKNGLDDLKNSLNPLTNIKLGVSEEVLPNKQNWNIE